MFSADWPYGKKLFVKGFAEFIFGIHYPKTLQNRFLQHQCVFSMLPLKNASFLWGCKYQKKKLLNIIKEGNWFSKTKCFTRKNNNYWYKLHKFLPHDNILNRRNKYCKHFSCQHFIFLFFFLALGNNFPYLLSLVFLAV